MASCLLAVASLLPLIIIAITDYETARRTIESEERLQTERLASNAKRVTAHFFDERLDALAFTAHEVGAAALRDPVALTSVLDNLQKDFGGFKDLGLVDETAHQIAYSGPYDLMGQSYRDQEWFVRTREQGAYISEVYRGLRNEPHIILAVDATSQQGRYYALRATVDTDRLIEVLIVHTPGEHDDIFLMNHAGIVQTQSRRYGNVLEPALLAVPPPSQHTESSEAFDPSGMPVILGSAYVTTKSTQTPFILMLSRPRMATLRLLAQLRLNRIIVVALSSLGILLVIMLTSSFMFNRLYDADMAKASALFGIQEASRLASLGRLSVGVAHEINNPLAVINEAAGYIKDLLSLTNERPRHEELAEQADAILESVSRCGTITKQLLGFARDLNLELKPINLTELIGKILSFHRKEAEYRGITVTLDVADDVPEFTSDPGRLQQVFLNLIGNAFQAMRDNGVPTITVSLHGSESVRIEIADTGCGIPKENLERIFEPFFTTKGEGRGTGLGLSITYGLIRRLEGTISVTSTEGVGTTFTVILPVQPEGTHEDFGTPR